MRVSAKCWRMRRTSRPRWPRISYPRGLAGPQDHGDGRLVPCRRHGSAGAALRRNGVEQRKLLMPCTTSTCRRYPDITAAGPGRVAGAIKIDIHAISRRISRKRGRVLPSARRSLRQRSSPGIGQATAGQLERAGSAAAGDQGRRHPHSRRRRQDAGAQISGSKWTTRSGSAGRRSRRQLLAEPEAPIAAAISITPHPR